MTGKQEETMELPAGTLVREVDGKESIDGYFYVTEPNLGIIALGKTKENARHNLCLEVKKHLIMLIERWFGDEVTIDDQLSYMKKKP